MLLVLICHRDLIIWQRDLTHVLRRSVEVTAKSGHSSPRLTTKFLRPAQ
jgi:hypothetical protein